MQKLVTIHRCDNPIEAHILKGRLVAAGFHCVIQGEHSGNIPEITALFMGGVQLQVPEDQAKDAIEELAQNTEISPFLSENS